MDEQQCFNAPYRLDWNGKVLKFGGIDQNVKAAVCSAAKLAAKREHDQNQTLFYPGTDADSIAKRGQADRDFSDKALTRYSWGGDLLVTWRDHTAEGAAALIGALLEAGGTPLERDDIEQLTQDKQKEITAILALIRWDTANPKAKRPPELTAILRSMIETPTPTPTTQPEFTQSSAENHSGSALSKSAA